MGIVACTYDFDKFVTNAGTESSEAGTATGGSDATTGTNTQEGGAGGQPSNTGGTTVANTMNGGTAGYNTTGGNSAVDAGAGGGAGATACSGVTYGGICWYYGALGSSCQQVCANHGQPATEAATFVGTSTQGGSAAKCGLIFGLLGIDTTPKSGTRSDGLGLGCHFYQTTGYWWLSSPAFSVTASQGNSSLVCGCNQ